ncbi:MAG: flavodoxin family protein [Dehalococcoidia bacterium]
MKILGVSCSPRKGGNTEILMREAMAGVEESGAEAELITIHDKDLKPCDGCRTCRNDAVCHIQDDMQEIYTKMMEADGILFGTPVYFWSVTAQAKIVIDRLNGLYGLGKLSNKIGGAIAVAGSQGFTEVRNLYYAFFATNHMFIADFVTGYAREKGQVKRDKFAMKASWELGLKMAAMAVERPRYPEGYDIPLRNLVQEKYGIASSPIDGRFEAP